MTTGVNQPILGLSPHPTEGAVLSRRAYIRVALTAFVVLCLAGPQAWAATSTDVDSGSDASPTRSGWVTLPTGDRVAYERDDAGIRTVGVEPAPGASGRYRTVDLGDHVRVIPFEAQGYVDSGQIDPAIFDVTALAAADDPTLEITRASGDQERRAIPTDPGRAHAQWVDLVGQPRADAALARPARAPGVAAIDLAGTETTERPVVDGTDANASGADDAIDPCTLGDDPNQPGPGKFPVTIRALDRRGAPSWGSFVLHDYRCRPWESYGYIQFGAPPDTGKTFYLPPAKYALLGDITTLDASGRFAQEITVGGLPEIDITGAREIVVDASDAVPIETTTRHESSPSTAVLGWTRGMPTNRLVTAVVLTPQYDSLKTMSAIPSDSITDGEFDFYPTLRETAPLVTASVKQLPDLHPKLLPGSASAAMESDLRLTDLAHPCRGCAIVVQEDPESGIGGPVADAVSQGAGAVIVIPAQPGIVHASVDSPTGPVLALSYSEGRAVLKRADRHTKVRVTVTPFSPYLYDLALHEQSRIPADLSYAIDDRDVHRVVQRFHGDGKQGTFYETRYPLSPCRCSLQPILSQIQTGSERVDYVSDNGSVWQQQLFKPGFTFRDAPHAYTRQSAATADWLDAPLTSGLAYAKDVSITDFRYPALVKDGTMTFNIPAVMDNAGHGGNGGFNEGRLFRNGQFVQDFTGFDTVPIGDMPTTWRLEIDHSHFVNSWASATASQVAWTFVTGDESSSQPAPLPMIDATIDVPVDLVGRPHGPAPEFTVHPWRLDGRSTNRVVVTMSFSTDGGLSWESAHVKRGHDGYTARPKLRGHGPVSMRLRVADHDGASVERTVHTLWTR